MSDYVKRALEAAWWSYGDMHKSPMQKLHYGIAAFLRDVADGHANKLAGMEPREALKTLAAAVERAAREVGHE